MILNKFIQTKREKKSVLIVVESRWLDSNGRCVVTYFKRGWEGEGDQQWRCDLRRFHRSLFSTPFYVDYDAVSSFQLGLPLSPPHFLPRPHVALGSFQPLPQHFQPSAKLLLLTPPKPLHTISPVWTATPCPVFSLESRTDGRGEGWIFYPLGMSISFSTRFYTWQSSQLFITFITFFLMLDDPHWSFHADVQKQTLFYNHCLHSNVELLFEWNWWKIL